MAVPRGLDLGQLVVRVKDPDKLCLANRAAVVHFGPNGDTTSAEDMPTIAQIGAVGRMFQADRTLRLSLRFGHVSKKAR